MDLSSFLLQQFVNAIFLGSLYSLIALGYTCLLYTSPSPRDKF